MKMLNRPSVQDSTVTGSAQRLKILPLITRSFVTRLSVFLKRLYASKTAFSGVIIIVAWVAVAISAPLWAPYDPLDQDIAHRLQLPSSEHLFGTDELGRDIFSRVLYGSRISLSMSVLVIVLAGLIGGGVGAIAGFVGGRIDELVMRVADVTLAFPAIVLAMAIAAALGPGLENVLIALVVVWWPINARIMRGEVLAVKNRPYILAARSIGASDSRILLRHVLHNSFAPLLVQFSMDLGTAIILIAGLSFIGLGAAPPSPEWGSMISLARVRFNHWWLGTFPALAIFSVVMAFSLLGDGLRDIVDPRLRGVR